MTSHGRLDVNLMNDLGKFMQSLTILQRTTYLRCLKNVSDDPAFKCDNDNKLVKYS